MVSTIRAARPEDHPHYARLFAELGVPDAPADPPEWSRVLVPETWVAEQDGRVIAFCWVRCGVRPVHVAQIVVDAACRGQHLGEALLLTAARRARDVGASEWRLNVKEENASAIRLYERMGFRKVSRAGLLDINRAVLSRLPPGTHAVAEVSDLTGLDSAFGLLEGTIAGNPHRVAGGRVLVVRGADGQPVGVGIPFVPRRGVYFFRLREAAAARPLLSALLDGLGAEEMHLWVEGNDPLVERLVAAGARTHFIAAQMHGPIPTGDPAATP